MELEKFVQRVQRKYEKQKRKKHHHEEEHSAKNFMSALLRKLNHESPSEDVIHHHYHPSQNNFQNVSQPSPTHKANGNGMVKSISANSLADRKFKSKTLTVALDGFEKSNSTNTSNVSTPISMHTSYRSSGHLSDSDSSDEGHPSPSRKSFDPENDAETIHEIKDQIAVELLPCLNKEAYSKHGRKAFLNWLFKLVCY